MISSTQNDQMNLYSNVELMEASCRSLANKDQSERNRAIFDLKFHIEAAVKELSPERFQVLENELFQVEFKCFFSLEFSI